MIGRTIQGYRIEALLGEGGMGKVYLATDLTLDRKVAIKNLNANLVYDETFLERFTNEARILSRLSHPHIALLYNYIQVRSDHYMVMEYIAGDNLDTYVRKHGAMSPERLVPVLTALLEGLGYAHQKGVLHRDIKPANLMLTPQHSVKIMDFGIARIADQATRLTKVKNVIGTLDYLAPELIHGEEPSPASDCYALGVVAYELATGGILPFKGTSEFALMQAIIQGKSLPPDKLNKAVPRKLANIIGKAMESDPAVRFRDTGQFHAALLNAFPRHKTIHSSSRNIAPAPTVVMAAAPAVQLADVPDTRVLELTKTDIPVAEQSTGNAAFGKRYRHTVYIAGTALLAVVALVFLLWPGDRSAAGKQEERSSAHAIGQWESPQGQSVAGQDPEGASVKPIETTTNDIQQLLAATEEPTSIVPTESKQPPVGSTDPQQSVDGNLGNKPAPVTPTVEETATEEKMPEKTPEKIPEIALQPDPVPATMVLDGQVVVNLRLQGALEEASLERGRTLSFSVTKPVTYRGHTIISKGAMATAEVRRVTSRQVSIRFNQVNSVSGRSIPFTKSELSGKLSDMLASPDFVVMLEKGITVP